MTDPTNLPAVRGASTRSRSVALVLAVLLGCFGVHRFYVGRIQSGIVQLLTLGGLGLWVLYDCILIGSGNFRDGDGRRVVRWDPEEQDTYDDLPPEVVEEIEALHEHIADLTERLDFAERMLADPSRRGRDAH